jgi:hypothetical protein
MVQIKNMMDSAVELQFAVLIARFICIMTSNSDFTPRCPQCLMFFYFLFWVRDEFLQKTCFAAHQDCHSGPDQYHLNCTRYNFRVDNSHLCVEFASLVRSYQPYTQCSTPKTRAYTDQIGSKQQLKAEKPCRNTIHQKRSIVINYK